MGTLVDRFDEHDGMLFRLKVVGTRCRYLTTRTCPWYLVPPYSADFLLRRRRLQDQSVELQAEKVPVYSDRT